MYGRSLLIFNATIARYGTFVIENEARLKALPPPDIAVTYYTGKDLYQFDEFQVSYIPIRFNLIEDALIVIFSNFLKGWKRSRQSSSSL